MRKTDPVSHLGLAVQANPKRLPGFFFHYYNIFIYLLKYDTIETYSRAFFMVIILSIGGVICYTFYSFFCVHTILRSQIFSFDS